MNRFIGNTLILAALLSGTLSWAKPSEWNVSIAVLPVALSECGSTEYNRVLKGSFASLQISVAYLTQNELGMFFNDQENFEVKDIEAQLPPGVSLQVGTISGGEFIPNDLWTNDLSLVPYNCVEYTATVKGASQTELFTDGLTFRRIYTSIVRIPDNWPNMKICFRATLSMSGQSTRVSLLRESDAQGINEKVLVEEPCSQVDVARVVGSEIRAMYYLQRYDRAINLADSMLNVGLSDVRGLAYGRYSAAKAGNWDAAIRILDAQYAATDSIEERGDIAREFLIDSAAYSRERAILESKLEER